MENEVSKYAKVGIHLSVLMPIGTCFVYNAGRKKWYNKFLTWLYGLVGFIELICILKDALEPPEKTATCGRCPYSPPLHLVQDNDAA